VVDAAQGAIERIMRLAFYVSRHPTFTLSQATLDIPGYGEVERDGDDRIDVRSTSGEAARRKFSRDLDDIAARFGIRTEFLRDDNEYRVVAAFFTSRERQVLLSAMALVKVAGIDDDDAELERLGRAVDKSGRRVVVTVHEHLTAIRAAMSADHPITFRYHDRDRILEPWVIGQWRNHWYVVGREQESDQRRVFRLDRIQRVGDIAVTALLDQTYAIPDQVEPENELRLDPNDWGHDPPVLATIDVHPEHAQRFRDEVGGRIVKGDGEWVRVELLVRDHESFRDRVLRMGTNARVHGPDEMVTLVRSWLQAMAGAT
jgi:predicted DNA-binding transcriptional regulator YafY